MSTRESLLGGAAAVPVALVIALDGLLGAHISGASMNPARSLGPVVVGNLWSHAWLYVLAPLVGAVIGTVLTHGLHGRYTIAEEEAAQGQE